MIYVVGIDPGPVCGVVSLRISQDTGLFPYPDVIQCGWYTLPRVLDGLWDSYGSEMRLAVERFQPRRSSTRGNRTQDSRITQDAIGDATRWAKHVGVFQHVYGPAETKTWASDVRLGRIDLYSSTTGMRHARDAARVALYCAVHHCGLRDPLSRKGE